MNESLLPLQANFISAIHLGPKTKTAKFLSIDIILIHLSVPIIANWNGVKLFRISFETMIWCFTIK